MENIDEVAILLPPGSARAALTDLAGQYNIPARFPDSWQDGLVGVSAAIRAGRTIHVITAEPAAADEPSAGDHPWPDRDSWRTVVDSLATKVPVHTLGVADTETIMETLRQHGLITTAPPPAPTETSATAATGDNPPARTADRVTPPAARHESPSDTTTGPTAQPTTKRSARNVLRIRHSGALSGRGDLILVTSGGGGPGKSTLAAALAADAAARDLTVCLIEASSGQPTQAAMLAVDPEAHLPSLFEAALAADPDLAFAAPEDINPTRPRDLRPVRFTLVPAPSPTEVDDAPIDTPVIARVTDQALDRFDLVVVDCPILKGGIEGQPLLDLLLPTLQFGNAWLVAVTEDSAPMLEDLVRRIDHLVDRYGVNADRILTVLNKLWPDLDVPETDIAAILERTPAGVRRSRYTGSIPMDPIDIKQRANYGVPLEHVAVMQPVIGSILSQVCDLDAQTNPWQPPPKQKRLARLARRYRNQNPGRQQPVLPDATVISARAKATLQGTATCNETTGTRS